MLGASGRSLRVVGREPPKDKRPMVVEPKGPSGKRPPNGWALALVGGAGEIRPPDSKWGETMLGTLACPLGVAGTATPKNNAQRSGYQNGHRGPETGRL